ncbi:MAG TPA: Asp-tRNA(Asn)/Glu-tRNA(Gln) amidotransferase GatCAB subunit B, partial [Syntrophobacteria bacterium]|nr:Asp-tRNA(Asn)/Glu-tRNA(Gln) amidotransferase GatCAB subunit B [Syntrophobacteria bacterium]
SWIEKVRRELPELPEARKARFTREYDLPAYDAGVLTTSKDLAAYFEACVARYPHPKKVSNWIMVELLRELNQDDREIEQCPVSPGSLADLLCLIDQGVISGKIAKGVFEEMYATGKPPGVLVEEKGLRQMSDEGKIRRVIDEVIGAHVKEADEYRAGKEKLFGFFVGQVMKRTQGKANPKLVNEMLRERLRR